MKQHASSSNQQHCKLTRVARRKESTGPQTSLGGGTPDGEEGEQTAQLSRGHTLGNRGAQNFSSSVRKVATFSFRVDNFWEKSDHISDSISLLGPELRS
jgi:hypothetical protein